MQFVRDKAAAKNLFGEKDFRWRGESVSRLEGFSDAVFAFSITLLVVSLEVPGNFSELLTTMQGFIAFGISFSLLIYIWFEHYRFFRRYGIADGYTIMLNSLLLFVVLFYIYPLKFLFTLLVNQIFGMGVSSPIQPAQMPLLMIIYSVGYFTIFFVLALLYAGAYRKRTTLDLNEIEIIITRSGITSNLLNSAIAILSILIAAIGGIGYSAFAGLIYILVGPTMGIYGAITGRKIRNYRNSENEQKPAKSKKRPAK